MNTINLSTRLVSRLFWEIIYSTEEHHSPLDRPNLLNKLPALDKLRDQVVSDPNLLQVYHHPLTGSISPSQAYSLYLLMKYFKPLKVIEIGTFIGKSTVSMGYGIDTYSDNGEIVTCDMSNAINIPFEGKTKITQFMKKSSTEMLSELSGKYDLIFIDGRIQKEDLPLLQNLMTPTTILILDDFEGMEKGVSNLQQLRTLELLGKHILISPPTEEALANNRFKTLCCMAILVPLKLFRFTNGG